MSTFTVLEDFVSLRRAIALMRAAETKDVDFGHNQIAVLYKLTKSRATIGELVEYTASDKASMTRTIASLEKMGFVKRTIDEKDRRVSVIELTPKGKSKAVKAQEIRNNIGRKLDSLLSNNERKLLSQLIEKIVNNSK